MRHKWLVGLVCLIMVVAACEQKPEEKKVSPPAKKEQEVKKSEPKEKPKQEIKEEPKEDVKTEPKEEPKKEPEKIVEDVNPILPVNPYELLVNKQNGLPRTFVPNDLVVPNIRFPYTEVIEKKHLAKEAAIAIEQLFKEAERNGIILYGVSGYRSYSTQERLFSEYSARDGIEKANRYSAKPGHSEHQTGLAMDISINYLHYQLLEEFGTTKEGLWVASHSWEYGFIVRYPNGKEGVTGYQYEPWHIRYVGKEIAKVLNETGQTYEEYLATKK